MDIGRALKQYFHLTSFRDPQEAIIRGLLEGKDTLVIMPTGGGKSLCYQLPAMLLSGVTVVVSPLIALMKDQVDALCAKGIPAAMMNSLQDAAEQYRVLDRMREGGIKIVYVAPERFRSESFMRAISNCQVSLVAVDEAHCLSQWGHDFRPDYLRIGQAIKRMGRPTVVALTATATPEVRADILTHLELRSPELYVSGFARPNLSFRVVHCRRHDDKYGKVIDLARRLKTGIVYCATRKRVEEVAQELERQRLSIITYHGGMSDDERKEAQDRFITGRADVAVATNAFGMGIDRPDLRFVVHFEVPGSLEAYYQEAGRAGRDGRFGECWLLFNYADKRTQEFFIEGSNPGSEVIRNVYRLLLAHADNNHEVALSIDQLVEMYPSKINPMAVSSAISYLARHGVVDRFDIPGKRIRGTRMLNPDLKPSQLGIDEASLKEKARRDQQKLEEMIRYAYDDNHCRQNWILRYFGESRSETCGCCDYCLRRENATRRAPDEAEALIVKKLLSGVARMSERGERHLWIARYGRKRILDCVLGIPSENGGNLESLKTFGILKGEDRGYLESLFRELEREGFLYTQAGEYPLVSLTELGSRVLLEDESYELIWPEKPEVSGGKRSRKKAGEETSSVEMGPMLSQEDEVLLARLKAKRGQLAAIRKVPPYLIFPNAVLEQLALRKPRTVEEGLLLPGVGPQKAKNLLPAFLSVIEKHGKARA